MPVDPRNLPKDPEKLVGMIVDLTAQLDRESTEKRKYADMLRELLDAQRTRSSERLSKEQLALFEEAWNARQAEEAEAGDDDDNNDSCAGPNAGAEPPKKNKPARRPLAAHLTRERIVHDLAEADKHCDCCGKDLRLIDEATSERYEYTPATLRVIEDVRLKYACDCSVRAADKPAQPIEKSMAGASLLAQIVVAKWADHMPLHRQEKIFARFGADISRKTMGGWVAKCAALLEPLYAAAKKELFASKAIGTDDTGVKVLDRKLSYARIGRIWPYLGDKEHPVILLDYTQTRGRDGPAKFLLGYRGYLQADAYSVYDAFFKPARGLTEVGCWMHARRYFFKALESDESAMGPALYLIRKLYEVEERARSLGLGAEARLALRQRVSAPRMAKLRRYLLELKETALPKSAAGAAVRYALRQWDALTVYLKDGELEIDNGATERANRDIAVGRGNWTFFGSDAGGRTAAVLGSFIATCKRCGVEPFAWFKDVLSRIQEHPVNRLGELLPHNWKPAPTAP